MSEVGAGGAAYESLERRVTAYETTVRELQAFARTQQAHSRRVEQLTSRLDRIIAGDAEVGHEGLVSAVNALTREVREVRAQIDRVERTATAEIGRMKQRDEVENAKKSTMWRTIQILGAASGVSLFGVASQLLQQLQ